MIYEYREAESIVEANRLAVNGWRMVFVRTPSGYRSGRYVMERVRP